MKSKNNNNGFTIMELMIAISILSIILLISSYTLTGIGGLFSKGANISTIQDQTRNVLEDVSSTIQFTKENKTTAQNTYTQDHVQAICFGTTRYSYILGFPATPPSQVFWKDQMTSSNCETLNIVAPVTSAGTALVNNNIHVLAFSITQFNSQLYGINLKLGFGSKDLYSRSGDSCINQTGQQYCATSSLSTFVSERLTN